MNRRPTLSKAVIPAAALVLLAAAPPKPAAVAGLAIDLRPVVENGAVAAIDVREQLATGASPLALVAPIVYPGVPGVADRMKDIRISDADGDVPMTTRDDPPVPGGFPYYRHWRADRAVHYPVTIRYRALVQPPGGPGGPPFGIRAVGGGVAGAGSGFLLLAETNAATSIRVHWDLGAFAGHALASTSFGDGDFTLRAAPSHLIQGWYLAGPAGRYPASGVSHGFSATWLGEPTFDAPAEMRWAAGAYAYLAHYFPHLHPTPPYRVFMRFLAEPPYGGWTALEQSFMLSRVPLRPGELRVAPRITLFHEMIHQWTGGIEAPDGISSWFSEGLTSYYQELIPMLGGFQSVDDYGRHLNEFVQDYYTSKARNWSAAKIAGVGFADEQVRHTPYRRSALYFYDLDARIRAKSGGKRNLDSLLFPMFLAREKGARFDTAAWIAMVTKELGPEEEGRFRRLILDGTDTLVPRADAFGPCFTREPATFKAADGSDIAGYRWMRVPGIPDSACRKR